MICATDVSCVNLLSVGLNPSIRVLIRYSNDFGIEVNYEELLKVPSNSLHWPAISLRAGERTDRTENKMSSGHLKCSPINSLTLHLKVSLVLLSIVFICNSGKLFTNLSVKRVVLTFSCIPFICNCSTWIKLSFLAAEVEPGFSASASKIC